MISDDRPQTCAGLPATQLMTNGMSVSAPRTVTITNLAPSSVTPSAATITGPNAADFGIAADGCALHATPTGVDRFGTAPGGAVGRRVDRVSGRDERAEPGADHR